MPNVLRDNWPTIAMALVLAAAAGIVVVDAWMLRRRSEEEKQQRALREVNRQIAASRRAHQSH